jgi:hypothetical protein
MKDKLYQEEQVLNDLKDRLYRETQSLNDMKEKLKELDLSYVGGFCLHLVVLCVICVLLCILLYRT